MSPRFEEGLIEAVWPKSRAQLIAEGVTARALSGSRWRATSHGFFVPAEVDPTTTTQRIVEASVTVPPGGALGGWAAGFAHGADGLDGLDPRTGLPLPVLVITGHRGRRRPADGRVVSRDRLDTEDVVVQDMIPVTSDARTTFDGARLAPDLTEAVAFVDSVRAAANSSLDNVARYVDTHPGWRGSVQARRAIALSAVGVRNAWESRLRMVYQLIAGLPPPLVNQPVFDIDGNLLGIADLFDSRVGLATEFDGQHHRDRRQHRADNVREELFEDAGSVVVRADSLDLNWHVDALAARLRAGYARATASPIRRWTITEPAWWRRRYDTQLTDAEKAAIFETLERE